MATDFDFIKTQLANITYSVQRFNGTGSQTAFPLAEIPASDDLIAAFINGVLQPNTNFSLSGQSVVFSAAPPSGVGNVEIVVAPYIAHTLINAEFIVVGGQSLPDALTRFTAVYGTRPQAQSAAPGLADGQRIEIEADADHEGRRTLNMNQAGTVVFVDYAPDAIRLQSYTALRAYTGKAQAINITTPGIAGRFNLDAADTTTSDNGGTVIVDGSGRRWKRVVFGVLLPEMFGLVGDGSDETVQLQRLIDSAVGLVVAWTKGKTYGYTSLAVPDGVTFRGSDFTLRRISSSVTPGLRLNNWFRAEYLKVTSPGGASGDRAIKLQGSYAHIDRLHIEADTEGVYNSVNMAFQAVSNPTGTPLIGLHVGSAYCKNYSGFFEGIQFSLYKFSNVVVEKYRTAFNIRDGSSSVFDNVRVFGLGNAVNGEPGENGLLLESTTAGATSDLVFNDWTVEDSGEHAYRLGGQQTIKNIWFNRCKSRRSGSSILSGNLSSGEWHGGCGFKILGGASAGGTRHKNIYLNQCQVYDVNPTEGSYPAGHGVNNFTPYMVVCSDGVYLNECIVDAEALPTAARNGILVGHSSRVYLNGCDFRKLRLVAIKPYQETTFAGFPDYQTPLEEFHIRGGKYEVVTTAAGSGLVFYMQEAALYPQKNWTIDGAEFRGGAGAMRIESAGAGGSYAQCRANFSYFDPTSVSDASATVSVIAGGGMSSWLVDFISNNRPSASSITVANGSVHRQMDTGLFRLRKAASWVTL